MTAELDRLGMRRRPRRDDHRPGQGSFVAELSRLRSAGATTVVMLTGNESIGIVRDAKAMGYNPNFTGVFWTLDEFSQAAGAAVERASRRSGGGRRPTRRCTPYVQAKANQYGCDRAGEHDGDGRVRPRPRSSATSSPRPAPSRRVRRSPRPPGPRRPTTTASSPSSFHAGARVADVAMFPIVCCNADNTWKGTGAPRLRF